MTLLLSQFGGRFCDVLRSWRPEGFRILPNTACEIDSAACLSRTTCCTEIAVALYVLIYNFRSLAIFMVVIRLRISAHGLRSRLCDFSDCGVPCQDRRKDAVLRLAESLPRTENLREEPRWLGGGSRKVLPVMKGSGIIVS